MSTATLFRPGGDLYDCVPRIIDLLPEGDQHAATKVFQYLVRMDLDGKLDVLITDQVIAEAIGYSTRFVQKGLHALEHKLGELGQAIIDRMPSQGRRIITFIRGLAPRRDAQPKATTPPPQTPPEDLKTKRETSTDTPPSSSSSSEILIPKTNPDDPAFAALVARACGLIPDATAERVGVTITTYGAEWVGQALDQVEGRNRKPNKLPVRSWRFVLGILGNWQREGGPPAPSPQAPPAPPVRRPAPEPAAPSRLTTEEVAELVARCASTERMTAHLGRVSLRMALRDGAIGPELLSTIPGELLPPPAGPEVPGAGPGS
jgi:hypothetical protein